MKWTFRAIRNSLPSCFISTSALQATKFLSCSTRLCIFVSLWSRVCACVLACACALGVYLTELQHIKKFGLRPNFLICCSSVGGGKRALKRVHKFMHPPSDPLSSPSHLLACFLSRVLPVCASRGSQTFCPLPPSCSLARLSCSMSPSSLPVSLARLLVCKRGTLIS